MTKDLKLMARRIGIGVKHPWALRGAKRVFLCFMMLGWVWGCSSSQDSGQEKPGDPFGKVEKLDGEVLVLRSGARETVHLHLGDPLFGGDLVTTEGGGAMELKAGENSILSVTSGSSIKINSTLAPGVEAPSVFLQRGRVVLRTRLTAQSSPVVLETFYLGVLAQAGELEAAVAEDLGVMVCVRQGESQVEGIGVKIPLLAKQETESDFLEKPPAARQYKERSEADWAAWMAARFRNLPTRMPELAAKMDRCLKETATERLEVRTQIERRNLEMESLARSLGEEENQAGAQREAVLKKLRGLARLQAESLVRLRYLGTRTEMLLLEAERLRRRLQNMKKELGEKYSPLEQLLRLLMEGAKPLAGALREERLFLAAQSQQWNSTVEAAGGLPPDPGEKSMAEPAKASPEEKKASSGSSAKEKAKSGSVPKSTSSKSSSGGSGGQVKTTKKTQPLASATKPETKQKSSTGGKAPSGSSSSKKTQSSSTQKANKSKSKQSSP